MSEVLIYDESKSKEIAIKKEKIRNSSTINYFHAIWINFGFTFGILLFYFNQDHLFYKYLGLIVYLILMTFFNFLNIKEFFYKRYLGFFNIQIYRDRIILPTDRLISILFPEYIVVFINDIERIYWNEIEDNNDDLFFISLKQPKLDNKYHPLIISKNYIHNTKAFLIAINTVGIDIDDDTSITTKINDKNIFTKRNKDLIWKNGIKSPYVHFVRIKNFYQ